MSESLLKNFLFPDFGIIHIKSLIAYFLSLYEPILERMAHVNQTDVMIKDLVIELGSNNDIKSFRCRGITALSPSSLPKLLDDSGHPCLLYWNSLTKCTGKIITNMYHRRLNPPVITYSLANITGKEQLFHFF